MSKELYRYGEWPSVISATTVAKASTKYEQIIVDDSSIYWLERRPDEGGRNALVYYSRDGKLVDALPEEYNLRTTVNEYGGGAVTVRDQQLFFCNAPSQQIMHLDLSSARATPTAITPINGGAFADLQFDPHHQKLLAVHETIPTDGSEATTSLVSIDCQKTASPKFLVSGADFYSNPALSLDGKKLAWISWRHPNMPWQNTELWVASFDEHGELIEPLQIGNNQSFFQPQWGPDGRLYFASDRNGWWNLYAWNGQQISSVVEMEAEIGRPQWNFGYSTYDFVGQGHIVFMATKKAEWQLFLHDLPTSTNTLISLPFTELGTWLKASNGLIVLAASSPTQPSQIIKVAISEGTYETLSHVSNDNSIITNSFSSPEFITFDSTNNTQAYGFYFPPHNPNIQMPSNRNELPPLRVYAHGGPTNCYSNSLNLEVQFWTSRGFAVLLVNYRGSSGFGKAYRQALDDNWGIVDVDDCIAGANFLVQRGDVDSRRMVACGGSAGGYTTLVALTFHDFFSTGCSYYGVGDLTSLYQTTHKFEAHYFDTLIGPYPEQKEVYEQRSPVNFVQQLSAPIILFQGDKDKVVPPEQAITMYEAVKNKRLPCALIRFAEEGHGFRQAKNIIYALEAELYFLGKVLSFIPADQILPIDIANLG